MEDNSNLIKGFRNVDTVETSTQAVRFLEAMNASHYVKEAVRLTYRLLGVREGAHLLDAGCGVGDVPRELGELVGKNGRVMGLDRSEYMVTQARQRTEGTGLPVEYQVGDIHHIPFPDESFDGCRSSRVFIYLDDPRQALSELLRVARPGGAVVLFEPELDSWILNGPDRDVVRKLVHFWNEQTRNPWIGRQLPQLFHSLGFTDIQAIPVVGTWTLGAVEQFGLRAMTDRAVAEGVVTRAQVDEWIHFMEEADKADSFFSASMAVVVGGRKPTK